MTRTTYYDASVDDTAQDLGVNPAVGLTADEAAARLERDGANEFAKEKPKTLLSRFFAQFKSVMIIILIIAAVISGVIGVLHGEGVVDSIIILIIVIVNAVIGVMQEAKVERSLEALEKMAAPQCKVVRDGHVAVIPSRELVRGDVVVIETGDLVPADLRLSEAVNLKIQEAALTGESAPCEKNTDTLPGQADLGDRDDMAFSSSTVTYGRGRGIVVATGMATEVGKIAGMLQAVPDAKTPLQERIDGLGEFLGIAVVVVCAVIFVAGFLQGRDLVEMFMVAVSLAAAAIPEGLPAVSTIVLAVGVQRLAKRNAIVRNLPSVETLGSASVICSDKTGTLTQNRMTVVKLAGVADPVDVPEALSDDQRRYLLAAVLANDGKISPKDNGWETSGDPTETAFLELAMRYGMDKNALDRDMPRVAEVPFDSERKMMSTVNRGVDGTLSVNVKGGVDEVLARCVSILDDGRVRPLTDGDRKAIAGRNDAMAAAALRVLAAAYRDVDAIPEPVDSATVERDMVFCGMAGIIDPPRPEVRDAVATCRHAGIKPVMITGDHMATAAAIAADLGILRDGDEKLTGAELAAMPEADLDRRVEDISVYARVAPEHKVRIVRALQQRAEIVAMTGDGVNDAPALKLADIGLAMGITGTDVSKGAADVVLADDNFATIVSAIEEGRRIYDNILKAIQFMLSTNLGEILVIFTAIMLRWPTPLLPIQILWINLVTDSLPALALSVDPADPDVMERKPVPAEQGIMRPAYLVRIVLQGVMIAGLSLAAFVIGRRTDVATAQTMTFAVLAFTQITHVLNVRSPNHSAFRNLFSNRLLWGALAIVIALMLIVLEIPVLHDFFKLSPIDRGQWFWIAALSLAPLPLMEIAKLLFLRKHTA
ncbi:MAG: calcium-translocating P-type ATPase, PMCA-type [Planctomycetaceae bacterium]|nr:calcium-translocating P-type ATPase, PMCA-type [Planctomycetaceae bacterium]